MLEIKVNSGEPIIVDDNDGGFVLGGKALNWDMVALEDRHFHIIIENKGYQAEIIEFSQEQKTLVLRVNGNDYSISAKDKYDLLLSKLGMENTSSKVQKEIKAPMPGLVLDIHVESGTELKKGDPVLVLEAMKMENILKAPGDGVVKSIRIEKGQAVEKSQILIELD